MCVLRDRREKARVSGEEAGRLLGSLDGAAGGALGLCRAVHRVDLYDERYQPQQVAASAAAHDVDGRAERTQPEVARHDVADEQDAEETEEAAGDVARETDEAIRDLNDGN